VPSARPKFIADADFNEKISDGVRLREPTVDFLNASDGGTRGLPDGKVLELAAASGRVLVSHDCNTMPREFYRRLKDGRPIPGLIIVRQDLDIGRAIEDLLLIWAISDEELRDRVRWVPMSG
jgi:hypothetical protein